MATWRPVVRKIQNNNDMDATELNKPVDDLIERTNFLKDRIDSITAEQLVVYESLPVLSDVEVGNVVYFDSIEQAAGRGLAKWKSEYGPNGELLAADSAYLIGVVISKATSEKGDVVTDGTTKLSSTALTNLFDTNNPTPGIYYLSATTPGKVTLTPPAMAIMAVQYLGNSEIKLMVDSFPKQDHIHKKYTLDKGWLDISDPSFAEYRVPAGAVLGYNRDADSDIQDLFSLYPGDAVVVDESGRVADDNHFVVNEDNIWYMQSGDPGTVRLWTNVPLTYGNPVIRAVRTDTPDDLTLQSQNGILTANLKDWQKEGDTEYSPTAIARVANRRYIETRVVSGIIPGEGLSGRSDQFGRFFLSLSSVETVRKYPLTVNLNNAMVITDGDTLLYTFPEDRSSSMVGNIILNGLSADITYKAYPFIEYQGILGNGQFPEVDFVLTMLSGDNNGTGIAVGSAPKLTGTFAAFNTTQYYKYFKQHADSMEVEPNATLYLTLAVTASAKNKNIYGFGVVIEPVL